MRTPRYLFDTPQGDALLQRILRFLDAPAGR